MDVRPSEAITASARRCRHPAEMVVLGNDRMEPVCALCGAELPFEVVLQGQPAAAPDAEPGSH